jgi:hypothetical protein
MGIARKAGRYLLGHLGTIVFVVVAVGFLADEVRFTRAAKHGSAVLVSVFHAGRSGQTIAQVVHTTDAGSVPAEMDGFFWHVKVGDVVPTVFAAGQSSHPRIDTFWQRHFRLIAATGFLIVVAAVEAAARRSNLRSEALDRRLLGEARIHPALRS